MLYDKLQKSNRFIKLIQERGDYEDVRDFEIEVLKKKAIKFKDYEKHIFIINYFFSFTLNSFHKIYLNQKTENFRYCFN